MTARYFDDAELETAWPPARGILIASGISIALWTLIIWGFWELLLA